MRGIHSPVGPRGSVQIQWGSGRGQCQRRSQRLQMASVRMLREAWEPLLGSFWKKASGHIGLTKMQR